MFTAPTNNPYANLPKVIEVLALDDAGEGGAAICPHCGAVGRYVYHFRCDDGTERGAMRGCFSKFPQHPFAKRLAAILAKEQEQAKRESWNRHELPLWDIEVRDAVRAYTNGTMTEQEAEDAIRAADRRKHQWMKSRGYR